MRSSLACVWAVVVVVGVVFNVCNVERTAASVCSSSPCQFGGTCQDNFICPPLHTNFTGFVTAAPRTYNPASQQLQGSATCITRDGKRFAVLAPGDAINLAFSGTVYIYNNTGPLPVQIATLPMSTTYFSVEPTNCQWNDAGTVIVFSLWSGINYSPTFTSAPGGVVLVANSTGGWDNYSRQYLVCNATVSADTGALVSISTTGDAQYIAMGLGAHSTQDGMICLFNMTQPNVWTEVNKTSSMVPTQITGNVGGGNQFGTALKMARFGARMLVSAAFAITGGCVYEISYNVGSGWNSSTGTTCISPPALAPYVAGFGVSLDATDDLSRFVGAYGPLTTHIRGGAAVMTKVNGSWVDLFGPIQSPNTTTALHGTLSGDPVSYIFGGVQIDNSGTIFCESDAADTGPNHLYSGVVWCNQLNSTGQWNLIGDIMPGLAIPNMWTGRSIAMALATTSQASLIVGTTFNSNNANPFPIGFWQLFGTSSTQSAVPMSCTGTAEPAYGCQCVPGYSGFSCQTNINECASAPCLNGATCADGINSFSCVCPAGWSGGLCQTNINECASAPCLNGGSCADGLNGFTCTCTPGWSGFTCQTNVNECASTPCSNGATCNDGINSFNCTCIPGFTGLLCQTNVNECVSSPCVNGGTCVDGINSFSCACVAGFSGGQCQTNVNECISNPCQNSGTCTDFTNGFNCTCLPGSAGTFCQTVLASSSSSTGTSSTSGLSSTSLSTGAIAGIAIAAVVAGFALGFVVLSIVVGSVAGATAAIASFLSCSSSASSAIPVQNVPVSNVSMSMPAKALHKSYAMAKPIHYLKV